MFKTTAEHYPKTEFKFMDPHHMHLLASSSSLIKLSMLDMLVNGI